MELFLRTHHPKGRGEVGMKIVAFLLMAAISLAGGAVTILPAPSYAQVYQYSPAPPDPYDLP